MASGKDTNENRETDDLSFKAIFASMSRAIDEVYERMDEEEAAEYIDKMEEDMEEYDSDDFDEFESMRDYEREIDEMDAQYNETHGNDDEPDVTDEEEEIAPELCVAPEAAMVY